MTELVLNLSRYSYQSISNTASRAIERVKTPATLQEIIFLGITLMCLQVLDGLLTGVGVFNFGVGIEANILIRNLMIEWGYVTALCVVKLSSIVIIAILCKLALSVHWVASALKGVIMLYLVAAIVPWAMILVLHLE